MTATTPNQPPPTLPRATATAEPERRTYVLTITDTGQATDLPFPIRMRAALKAMLRTWRLRCTDIRPAPTAPKCAAPATTDVSSIPDSTE